MTQPWHTHFETILPAILAELEQFVAIESPTYDKPAVDKLGQLIFDRFAQLGCVTTRIPQEQVGDCIRAQWGFGEEQILVIGHFDTVKPIGTLEQQPWRIDAGKIYGPGIFDMKAGIVFSLFALKTIIEAQLRPNKQLVFLWNSDEEVGSPFSVTAIEAEAQKSSAVLVVEPAHGAGALKTSRKGGGEFRIQVYGTSAHAGNDHEKGANAIAELAQQIVKMQAFTDYAAGTTVSVGLIEGGTRVNVVPDYAQARIDVRAKTIAQAKQLTDNMLTLQSALAGTRVVVEGGFDKPPMERTDGTIQLFQHAQHLATLEGFALTEASVGGMSDGNYTSALGIPTLDGLGAVGDGAHAVHEHIVLTEIPQRIALLLQLLVTL